VRRLLKFEHNEFGEDLNLATLRTELQGTHWNLVSWASYIGSDHSCGAAPMRAKSERPQGALAAARARKAWQSKARTRKAWQRKARVKKARQRKVTDLVAKLIDLNCRGDNFN
jgi:hypothetical protein